MPAPTSQRLPRSEFWADKSMTVSAVRQLIDELDPVEHDTEITHLSLEVMTPAVFAMLAVNGGTARGMIHPAEALVGYRNGTGDGMVRPLHRSADTMAFFGLFMREGYRSDAAQAVFDRVQQIHHDVHALNNDLQLHILGLLVTEADRLVEDLGHASFFSEKERQARYNFWRGVGAGMGIHSIPGSYDELRAWVDAFEAKHHKPSEAARLIYRKQQEVARHYLPVVGGQVQTATLSQLTKQAVSAPRVAPGVKAAVSAVLWAVRATEGVRRVNLSTTWVTSFSRLGENPDIHKLGYQHDQAADKRYQKVGNPADGYRYTVAQGLQSAADSTSRA